MSRIGIFLDRIGISILALGAIGHTFGAVKSYAGEPVILVWSLCATALVALAAGLNFLRAARPGDRPVAWLASLATACWLAASVGFGLAIGKPFDPRVVLFAVACLLLLASNLRALRS